MIRWLKSLFVAVPKKSKKRTSRMPSVSDKQKRTMQAAAHDPAFAARMGIPQHVAKEFETADKAKAAKSKSKKKGK